MGTCRAVERMTNGDQQALVNVMVDAATAGDRSTVVAMLTYGAEMMGKEGECGEWRGRERQQLLDVEMWTT